MYLLIHIVEVTDTDQDAVALSFSLDAWICDRDYPSSTNFSESYRGVTRLKSRLKTSIS